jgi:hypothetical protein
MRKSIQTKLIDYLKLYDWQTMGNDFDWEVIKVITKFLESKGLKEGTNFNVYHEPNGGHSYPDIQLDLNGKSFYFECKTGKNDSSIMHNNTIPGDDGVIYLIRTYGPKSKDFTFMLDKDMLSKSERSSLQLQKHYIDMINTNNSYDHCFVYARTMIYIPTSVTKYTKDYRRLKRESNVYEFINKD